MKKEIIIHPETKDNAAYIDFNLKGAKGVVRVSVRTDFNNSIGIEFGYHAYIPQYETHTGSKNCCFLDGETCYYDGSSIAAENAITVLREQGSEGVWNLMEKWYESLM